MVFHCSPFSFDHVPYNEFMYQNLRVEEQLHNASIPDSTKSVMNQLGY